MLNSAHRTGPTPVAARFRASTALAAILAPMIVMAPVIAHAADPLHFFGDKELTNSADMATNDKTIDLTQDIDFLDGEDGLTNNGVITVGANATTPVKVSLISLEALLNKGGLVDLRNGHTGDVLSISGDYNGSGKARLGLDVGPDGADQLIVGDIANGSTAITLGVLSAKTAVLTGDKGPILIQAGAGSKDDAFTIENNEIGFIHYSMVYDAKTAAYRLKGVAGQRAYEALKFSEGASTVWRQSAEAWSAHVASLRDAGTAANGAGLWGQAYGARQDRDDDIGKIPNRFSIDYEQTTYGGQMGVDLINAGLDDGHITLGVTGGYADAKMRFSGVAGQQTKLSVVNLGGYVAITNGGFFVNALAKADRQSIKARNTVDGIDAKFDGKSFGAQVETGHRFGDDALAYETLLGVSYVSTRLDDMETLGQRLDFDNATGFVAKAGVRGSARSDLMSGVLTTYGAAFVAHDFTVKNGLTLVSGGQSDHLSKDGGRTFGQLTVGASYRTEGGTITFAELGGDYGGGRSGGGLRVGARVGF